ncbi:uncharacterized protein LOC108607458 [Drosophila busckii]|uniref:uncharacterized protein LOC108607458 n=1 Tax=Drosophila busckii TaxID=30019 RepID=UPI001433144A|nr:uncharacterized protein LOC108607458 [Drosophila busckii]
MKTTCLCLFRFAHLNICATAMSEFNSIFKELKTHFAPSIEWTDIEDWLCEADNGETKDQHSVMFWSLPMCRQIIHIQDQQLQTLRDLCNCIRAMRSSDPNSFDIEHDNWENIEDISPKQYLAFIYALSSLAKIPQQLMKVAPQQLNEHRNIQLALSAVSAYFLTITIPGAKSYGIFDEDIIEHCLKVFKLLETNGQSGVRADNLWIQFSTICDDIVLVFRYVQFKDHIKPRDNILRCLLEVIYLNCKTGNNNSCARQVQAKCFELLTEIANEHNGKVYDTLMLIMKLTFSMHIYPQGGEQISDWFINQIEVQPETIAKVLQFYIECVITNPIREWKPCDEKVAIGYAAKYDAALYAKCNKCCAKFLLDAVRADDAVGIQVRSLDLIERMLQQQVQVEWSLFRHDVSTMPREVALLRETIRSINDKTITVRRKACQVLNVILRQSCPITTRILNECISFVQFSDDHSTAGHLRPQPVQYAYSFEGAELLEPEVIKLPEVLYQRYLSAENGLARCAGISLLERLVLINPRIMYDTDFEQEMSRLAVDMLSSVRRAALDMVDNLLEAYCDCSILVRIYCRIWPCLLNDEDIALQKLAIQSFNRKVLRNIVALEYTNGPKQLLPWCILTTLLRLQPRDYLKQRLTILLQQEPGFVTLELVNTIISHLSTSMATEAWSLLLLLSSRIQNNLDVLINTLNRLSSCNNVFNQILAFQLISYCMPRFSKSALNQLFNRLCDALSTGSLCLPLVSPAILLLGHIDGFAHSQAPEDSTNPDDWKLNLLRRVTIGISECTHSLNDVVRLECLLGCYSDLIVMTSEETDMMVFDLALSYLKMYVQLDEANFDTRNERFMNWMVVVAGRLSLRDNNLAHRLANLYGLILTKNDRPQLVNSTLIALNDLGKKYPSILENNMQCILIKLNSKYSMTRVRTYRCVKDVILAGNIKLKGAILIALLSGLVDESVEVVREADAFFIRYQKLYDKLLFQHCLKEVPFDFNDQTFLNGSQRVDPNYSSPLKGRAMCKKRRLIYNHIIASLDHNTLLMYFGQLKLLAEKTKDKTFIKSTGAIDVVLDILFIMRRICLSTKTKRQGGAPAEGEQEAEVQEEAAVPVELHATATDKSTAKSRGRGGARKRDLGEEALKQLERSLRYVEETQRNLSSVMNAELQHEIDLMCKAMSMRFPSYTDFAQPAQFWKKYKHTKSTRGKPKRRNNDEPVDDQSTESNSESDSELPLDRHKHSVVLPEKLAERSNTMDYLATELLFQPH